MNIIINGKKYSYEKEITINEMLVSLGKQRLPLAVRINGKTVPRKNFGTTTIKDGDKISLIVFLGGG